MPVGCHDDEMPWGRDSDNILETKQLYGQYSLLYCQYSLLYGQFVWSVFTIVWSVFTIVRSAFTIVNADNYDY